MKIFILIVFLLAPFSASANTFAPFQKLLDRHLNEKKIDGKGLETSFNYDQAIKENDTLKLLEKQKEILKGYSIKGLNTKEKAIAFWINSYNFFMISIILEKGFKNGKRTIDGVKDFGSFFSPYRIFKQEINNIGGKKYSLDQIEKETLLGKEYKEKGWKDARVHFAVNCASVGCPPLLKKVYDSETLNTTLDQNIKQAFHTPRHLRVEGEKLYLSHLFKWYRDDFKESEKTVRKFIYKYIDNPSFLNTIKNTNDINYIDYDWSLNRPENF